MRAFSARFILSKGGLIRVAFNAQFGVYHRHGEQVALAGFGKRVARTVMRAMADITSLRRGSTAPVAFDEWMISVIVFLRSAAVVVVMAMDAKLSRHVICDKERFLYRWLMGLMAC
jgi:hypothetical protein